MIQDLKEVHMQDQKIDPSASLKVEAKTPRTS